MQRLVNRARVWPIALRVCPNALRITFCAAVHFAVGANEANEASPAITQLRRTGAITTSVHSLEL